MGTRDFKYYFNWMEEKNLVKLTILILCSFQAMALWSKVHSSTSFYLPYLKGKFNTRL